MLGNYARKFLVYGKNFISKNKIQLLQNKVVHLLQNDILILNMFNKKKFQKHQVHNKKEKCSHQ